MGLEVWTEIITEYNGRTIKGSFKFIDGIVTVRKYCFLQFSELFPDPSLKPEAFTCSPWRRSGGEGPWS